ncbi:MAG: sulfotransferase domain-containing protein [Gammaproteobacteria bacterium]|nr:sulfotransferase domain-containing protein [Gammaproteobacteria bacterium]MDH5803170.1 sulfotransferase domain-containing protein [Gammaproteobacteria bacterium]
MSIQSIQIYGERCSGTNYLEHLLQKNYPTTPVQWDFGWKHFFTDKDLTNSDHCLFIVIYRGPFDWLRSLHRQPWHTTPALRQANFSAFIRAQWHCIWDEHWENLPSNAVYGSEMMFERDPKTGERFDNVIQMRTAKIHYWQALQETVKNIVYVRYEDLKDNPKAILNKIAHQFGIKTTWFFHNEFGYKGEKGFRMLYRPRVYTPITPKDVNYIEQELDWSLENSIGYEIDSLSGAVSTSSMGFTPGMRSTS